jgi:hypothetical protein
MTFDQMDGRRAALRDSQSLHEGSSSHKVLQWTSGPRRGDPWTRAQPSQGCPFLEAPTSSAGDRSRRQTLRRDRELIAPVFCLRTSVYRTFSTSVRCTTRAEASRSVGRRSIPTEAASASTSSDVARRGLPAGGPPCRRQPHRSRAGQKCALGLKPALDLTGDRKLDRDKRLRGTVPRDCVDDALEFTERCQAPRTSRTMPVPDASPVILKYLCPNQTDISSFYEMPFHVSSTAFRAVAAAGAPPPEPRATRRIPVGRSLCGTPSSRALYVSWHERSERDRPSVPSRQ